MKEMNELVSELKTKMNEAETGLRKMTVDLENMVKIRSNESCKRNTYMQSLMDNFPTGITIIQMPTINDVVCELEYDYMNKEFLSVIGWEEGDIEKVSDLVDKVFDDDKIRNKIINDLKKTEFIEWDNIPIVNKDGKRKYISMRCIPLKEYNSLVTAAWDVTDRVLAEKELKRNKEFIDSIVDNIPDNLILLNPHKKVIWSNNNEFKMGNFFCPFRGISSTCPCSDCENDNCIFHDVFASGETHEIELKVDDKYISYKAAPCHKNGKVSSAIILMRDVTARKLSADRKDMEELQKMVSIVISSQSELADTIMKLREEDA